jgi:hypothetical protein
LAALIPGAYELDGPSFCFPTAYEVHYDNGEMAGKKYNQIGEVIKLIAGDVEKQKQIQITNSAVVIQ